MDQNLINETLNSNLSLYIPNIIKEYLIQLTKFNSTNYYSILNKKSFTFRNVCDNKFEEYNFYFNFYNDLNLYYKPLLKKYPFLTNNFNSLINFSKNF